MKINYVISDRVTRFHYRGQMFNAVKNMDGSDAKEVLTLKIYKFDAVDIMNDITDYKVESTHRVEDGCGMAFDVIVLVNSQLGLKRDLIFMNAKLYLSGVYGININHTKNEYIFLENTDFFDRD